MNFIILRRLTPSELGMFKAYRRAGRERSKQRAINFDGKVVDRVFPSAKDSDAIEIECTYQQDASTTALIKQWLKRQAKNWRFEGNCPESDYYDFVKADSLFAMVVEAGKTPASAAWVVIPNDHPTHRAILNHPESGGLGAAGMIALYGAEGAYTRRILGETYPSLFPQVPVVTTPTPADDNDMAPDPLGLFRIMANAGHTLPSAIADLVDNAISAGATEISISFPNPNLGGRWLCITDNGRGMNSAELRKAMRIGSRRDYDSKELGKYGYGLKGASWSQANNLTVQSRAEDHPAAHLTWDHDHLEKVGKWEILDLPIPAQYAKATQIPETGTAVLLTQMHVPAEPNTVRGVDPYFTELTEMREHLSLVFHRFLEGRARGHTTISITVEGKKLEPNDPVGHPLTNKKFSPKNITIEGRTPAESATLMLQAYVLPTAAEIDQYHAGDGPEAVKAAHAKIALGQPLNPMQGFYFYRVDRLIKWGGWCGAFALEEHMKLSRVTVDFNRQADDFLKVNVSKRDVTLGVNLIEQFKVAVKEGRQNALSLIHI